MGGSLEVMVREDSEPSFLVNVAWIRVDLREIAPQSMVLENGLDEESIGVTHDPQLAPENTDKTSGGRRSMLIIEKSDERGGAHTRERKLL